MQKSTSYNNVDRSLSVIICRALLSLLAAILLIQISSAQNPRMISYQGVLTDSVGNPKADGSYAFKFSLYNVAVGGSFIWSETKTLSVKRGLFTTALGDVTPFSASLSFKSQLWLGISVSDSPELSPRITLLSVPASFWSQYADSAETVADNSITSAKIVNGTIKREDLETGLVVPKSDTALYALSAPQSQFVDSARVAGTIPDNSVTNAKITNGTIQFGKIAQNGATTGQVMKWNGSNWMAGNDDASQWSSFGSDIYYSQGKVGIGSLMTGTRLTISDSLNGLGVWTNNPGGVVAAFGSYGTFRVDAPGVAGGRFNILENGNVGIGTPTPSTPLEVVGSITISKGDGPRLILKDKGLV